MSSIALPAHGLLTVAALFTPLAIASAQTRDMDGLARTIAGCYETRMGPWSGPLPATGSTAAHTPPARFQLDTVAVRSLGGRFAVQPSRLVDFARLPAAWKPLGGDSVSIVWSTGFIGVGIRLAVEGDSLVGRALTFHDAHTLGEPADPVASVVARRVPCPS